MTGREVLLVIASVAIGGLPLGYMVDRLQMRVRETERQLTEAWAAIARRPDRAELELRGVLPAPPRDERAAPHAGGAARNIDDPSERREA